MNIIYPSYNCKVPSSLKVVFLFSLLLITELAYGETNTPEINLKQGTTNKLSGSDYTFANQNVKTTGPTVTFTIENSGTGNLTISNITLTGANADQFTLNKTATTLVIAPGTNTTFTLDFSPKNNVPGIKNAVITIVNNDADEETYILNVTGTAVILAATISSLSPVGGAAEGATATINGTNLINTTGVTFNGVPAASFSIVSNTRVTAIIPPGATSGPISVSNAGGTIISAQTFYILPKITSFTPTFGPTDASVVITGTSFTGTTSVKFNGTEASFTVNSATKITALVPANASTGIISVTTPSGTGTSSASFTPPPSIISIIGPGSASSAIIGNTITINGTSFTSAATVKFTDKSGNSNSVTATKTFVNNTQLTAVIPVGAATGLVTVTTTSGSASAPFNITNTTYTWNNTSASWANPNSWTPARTSPSTNDLLIFESVSVNPVLDFASSEETIGYLNVVKDVNVTFSVATDKTLNINNDVAVGTAQDFIIATGAKLVVTNSTAGADLIINILPGATGTVVGTITFLGVGLAEHRLYANNISTGGNTLVFQSGSTFYAGANFSGSPFGSTYNNSVQFSSNSVYYNQSVTGGSPFGTSTSNVVVFEVNTVYRHDVNTVPDLLNRTYGTISFNAASFNQTITGTGNLTILKDLILSAPSGSPNPVCNLNLVGTITIGRNITVTKGSLSFNPATATTIKLTGSAGGAAKAGTISGAGTAFNLGPNANLTIEPGAVITLTRNIVGTGKATINGTVTTANSNGLMSGTNTSFASSLRVTLNPGSTVEYNGTASQTVSAGNYANLTISSTRADNSTITLPTLPATLKISEVFSPVAVGVSYTTTTTTIEFNGGEQTIPPFNYYNLVISGTGDKLLGESFIVGNNVNMVANNIITESNFLILGTAATITGEAEGRYVVGNLSVNRIIDNAGSDFGGIGFTLGNGAQTGSTSVTRVAGPGSSILIPENGHEGINRRWEVLPTNQPAGPVNVTLAWVADDDNGKDLSSARVWKTQGDDLSTYYDVSKVNQDASNHQISATVTSFSTLTVSDENNPLPVELTYFNVVKKGQNAVLTWQTATEKNNAGFGIEASSDAIHFEGVGFVKSLNPNATTLQDYTFTHRPLGTGTIYYRLKQTDWNGTNKYYGPKALRFDQVVPTLLAYPNPVTDKDAEVTVQVGAMPLEKVTITVTDALGKVVYHRTESKNSTGNELKVNVQHLPAGIYILNITTPTNAAQTKIVKQ
ncbi:choice-of-anchor D domain-containing protein [Adhaeribacter radiodurans]|uniref:Choice-of-anchor D domain-containing protein n=1 Tax=Adhaeribacter radiodurans TaxID=2745197 RepID=A0A7L7LDK7_9BACT|nr:choice-of-anchor D domain-containing protein [Adhaeribacter radiodurans]QMU30932.1 choice-of-anchor D domain-containing protein [Adhaeribacter radiodurans]